MERAFQGLNAPADVTRTLFCAIKMQKRVYLNLEKERELYKNVNRTEPPSHRKGMKKKIIKWLIPAPRAPYSRQGTLHGCSCRGRGCCSHRGYPWAGHCHPQHSPSSVRVTPQQPRGLSGHKPTATSLVQAGALPLCVCTRVRCNHSLENFSSSISKQPANCSTANLTQPLRRRKGRLGQFYRSGINCFLTLRRSCPRLCHSAVQTRSCFAPRPNGSQPGKATENDK